MIEVRELTKRYGAQVAVDRLTFDVAAGRVTGFLGPNGAGKSTTLRLIVGLDVPDSGTARIGGCGYRELRTPLREVGTLLDPRALQPGRTGFDHLLWLARSNGLGRRRVEQVLEEVELSAAAGRRAGGYSLGMLQRLGIAAALLGDPAVLLLDEPINGLDLDGIRWLRSLLRQLADEGRTVLLSSHLMSEMELVADDLVVIGGGRLIAQCALGEFLARRDIGSTLVRSPDGARLAAHLLAMGAVIEGDPHAGLRVTGPGAAEIGTTAAAHGIVLHELVPLRPSLEDAYSERLGQVPR